MHLSVTIGVEKEQVGEIVRATVDPIENMMNVPSTLPRIAQREGDCSERALHVPGRCPSPS
jgi:hypothetical protein